YDALLTFFSAPPFNFVSRLLASPVLSGPISCFFFLAYLLPTWVAQQFQVLLQYLQCPRAETEIRPSLLSLFFFLVWRDLGWNLLYPAKILLVSFGSSKILLSGVKGV